MSTHELSTDELLTYKEIKTTILSMKTSPELVDREEEFVRLRLLQKDAPSLAVIRGRRRVGKSYLLAAALGTSHTNRVVSFQADEQPSAAQLALFSAEASRLLPGAPPLSFSSWDEALAFIGEQTKTASVTLILDEFQYLCRAEPSLPAIIMRWWDRWQTDRRRISLVLCGSAISFMEGLVGASGALHGRAVYRPLVSPLDYRSSAEFAPAAASSQELIERFAVLGGTPQYQEWAGKRPLARVIEEVVLTKGAPLYEELLTLLRSEDDIRDRSTYFGVLRAVAEGRTKTTQIAGYAGLSVANVSKIMDRLRDLRYVDHVIPLGFGDEPRRGYWKIADPFFAFWFRYVFPNRSRLERGLVDVVQEEISADFGNYVGRYAFEDCCRVWAGRFAPFAGDLREVGSWWSRKGDVEIDVVGTAKDRYAFVGSCKWSERADERSLFQLYDQRAKLGPKAARARMALFSRREFSKKVHDRAASENVLLVSSDDLFD